MKFFPSDVIPEIKEGGDYLPESFELHLTPLEAGFIAGMLIDARETNDLLLRLVVRVRGKPEPVILIDHLIEKFNAERERRRVEDGG